MGIFFIILHSMGENGMMIIIFQMRKRLKSEISISDRCYIHWVRDKIMGEMKQTRAHTQSYFSMVFYRNSSKL